MKSARRLRTIAICLSPLVLMSVSMLFAADKTEPEEKADKGLRFGRVQKVTSTTMVANHGKAEVTYNIADARFSYIGFIGSAGKNPDGPQAGFNYKGGVDGNNNLKSVLLSPGLPPPQQIPNKTKMTAKQLFDFVDENHNNAVDYVEYAKWVYQSDKHYIDKYRSKFDTNADDVLDLAEFTKSLDEYLWWTFSKLTPESLLADHDADKNGEISVEEFSKFFKQAGHSTPDAAEKTLKKLDKDKTNGLNKAELATYLEETINNHKQNNGHERDVPTPEGKGK